MVNRVVLVGRLTKDVEMRKTQSGLSVASFTLAVSRRISKQSQQENPNQQSADFISCVAWRQTADILASYTRKGSLIAVEGKIQSRTYDDAQGTRHYVTEVSVDTVDLLESKSSSQRTTQDGGFQQPSYAQPQQQSNTTNEDFGSPLDVSSDDLPF